MYRCKFGSRFHDVSIPSGINVQEVFVNDSECSFVIGCVEACVVVNLFTGWETSQQIITDLGGKACCLYDRNDRIHFWVQ